MFPKLVIPVNRKRFPHALVASTLATLLLILVLLKVDTTGMLLGNRLNWLFVIPWIYIILLTLADYIKTLFDRSAMLTVSDTGLDDSLSIFSCGHIPWTCITGTELRQALKTNFLLVKVKNPEALIAGKGFWKKYTLNRYVKRYGTPVILSEGRMKYNLLLLHDRILQEIAAKTQSP
jgi:hypothetical protein